MPFDQNQTSFADNLLVLIGFMPVPHCGGFFICQPRNFRQTVPLPAAEDLSRIRGPAACWPDPWIFCV